MSPADTLMTQSSPTAFIRAANDTDLSCNATFVSPLFWAIISTFCAGVGVPANVLHLWGLVQKQCNGLSDIYMLNLAVMNLCVTSIILPDILNFFLWRCQWIDIMVAFFLLHGSSGQPMFIACICMDCYMAVAYPIPYMKLKHSRHRQVACGLVWGLAVVYGATMTVIGEAANSSLRVIPYVLTLPAIVFCDLAIICTLRKPDASGRRDVHPQKQRAMQTITNSLIISVVSFLPPLVIFLFLNLLPLRKEDLMCNVIMPTLLAPLLGSTVMWLHNLLNIGLLKDLTRFLDMLKPFN